MSTTFAHKDEPGHFSARQTLAQIVSKQIGHARNKPAAATVPMMNILTEVPMTEQSETKSQAQNVQGKRTPRVAVADWMTAQPITVGPDTPLSEAYSTMMRGGIRRLPVVQNSQVVGILTLGDLREAKPSTASSLSIYELNYLIASLKVEQVMTHNPLTVEASAPVKQAARMMLENKIGSLPVLDDKGELVGIITESDIFRMVVDRWNE